MRTYTEYNNYMDGRCLFRAVDYKISGNMITFYSEPRDVKTLMLAQDMFTCLKSDIKIIGDLFDMPRGAIGDGWME